jgi:hypothetical protein
MKGAKGTKGRVFSIPFPSINKHQTPKSKIEKLKALIPKVEEENQDKQMAPH